LTTVRLTNHPEERSVQLRRFNPGLYPLASSHDGRTNAALLPSSFFSGASFALVILCYLLYSTFFTATSSTNRPIFPFPIITDLDTLNAPGSTFNQVNEDQYHIYNNFNSVHAVSPFPTHFENGDPSSSEPQNAPTTLFTEQEWKVLKEHRVSQLIFPFIHSDHVINICSLQKNLPRIFSDVYHIRPWHERVAPIDLRGVAIDPCGPPYSRVSVLLVKFLRAQ
jgi:hypothetical protein